MKITILNISNSGLPIVNHTAKFILKKRCYIKDAVIAMFSRVNILLSATILFHQCYCNNLIKSSSQIIRQNILNKN